MKTSNPLIKNLKVYAFSFFEDLRGSLIDLSIIVGIIAFYQFAILQTVPEDLTSMRGSDSIGYTIAFAST